MQGHLFCGSSCDYCKVQMLVFCGEQAAANRSQPCKFASCNQSIQDKIPQNLLSSTTHFRKCDAFAPERAETWAAGRGSQMGASEEMTSRSWTQYHHNQISQSMNASFMWILKRTRLSTMAQFQLRSETEYSSTPSKSSSKPTVLPSGPSTRSTHAQGILAYDKLTSLSSSPVEEYISKPTISQSSQKNITSSTTPGQARTSMVTMVPSSWTTSPSAITSSNSSPGSFHS
jgi:hypothetical protein